MNVAILGAGPGAFSIAAELYLTHPDLSVVVAAYSDHGSKIDSLNKGALQVRGIFDFEFFPNTTFDVPKAISEADLIFVVVPAFAQDRFIQDLVRSGRKSQSVLFVPGNFASLFLQKNLKIELESIGEIDTLPYASKFFKKNELTIKVKKSVNRIAFLKSSKEKSKKEIWQIFPSLIEEASILKLNLINFCPPLHVATTILNASRIEEKGAYETSSYDISPSVADVIAAIDLERKRLCESFKYPHIPILDILKAAYPSDSKTLYDFLKSCKAYQKQISPASLEHRYVREEIPFHFVPITLLGKQKKIPMPLCEAFIYIAGALNKTDYWKNGRDIRPFFS